MKILDGLKLILRNSISGFLSGILCVNFTLATVTMLFSAPEMSNYLGVGVIMGLAGLFIANIFTSLMSNFNFSVSTVDPVTNAVIASAVTAIVSTGYHNYDQATLISTALVLMPLSSLFLGCVSYFLGHFKLGNLVRYIPFPVIGGFIASTGWIVLKGSVISLLGRRPFIEIFQESNLFFLFLTTTLYGVYLYWVVSIRKQRILALYSFTFLIIITFSVLYIFGISFESATDAGWFFEITKNGSLEALKEGGISLGKIEWRLIIGHTSALITSTSVALMLVLLGGIGVEEQLNLSGNLNQELKMTGVSNIFAGICGSMSNNFGMGTSLFNYELGANSRISGLIIAFLSFLALCLGAEILTYIPKYVLIGFLVMFAISILTEWMILTYFRLPFFDYIQIVLIILSSEFFGLPLALVLGIVLSCFQFILQASRLNPVKLSGVGVASKSSVVYPYDCELLLQDSSKEIYVLRLQGILFFGLSHRLFIEQAKVIQKNRDLRYVIIDFQFVSSIDLSSKSTFVKFYKRQKRENLLFIIVGMDKHHKLGDSFDELFKNKDVIYFSELDQALVWCENSRLNKSNINVDSFLSHMFFWFKTEENFKKFLDFLAIKRVKKGEILIQQEDPGEEIVENHDLYILKSGRLGAYMGSTYLSTFLPGAIIGEMAFFSKSPRTASIMAIEDCEIYVLTKKQFDSLRNKHPALSDLFENSVLETLIIRLKYSNTLLYNMIG